MEVGSGNDNTVDSFVSPDDAVDLDLPVTPRSTEVPIFQSKMKEKEKVTDSSHDPELEADTIAGSKPSTALSGAGLCSDETEQDVDRDDVVREISVFCGSGNFGEDTQLYVVQHVLRGAGRPYELNKRCEEVRWKPKQQKMEVDLRMERDHENYDHERSESLNLKKQVNRSDSLPACV
ncbi:hypothetical protein IEQ34_022647 [Dendrobium chrysotoxum]|uniref:Uncharacterized protein n=1 Tax=Dendrobium chrysotoxum TaxID=161865 RepID=A0AAV7FZM0_DENCH|nr:hypothetical protein IEQ34_022647 [Dendrobium chrysotoxum]